MTSTIDDRRFLPGERRLFAREARDCHVSLRLPELRRQEIRFENAAESVI